MRIITTIKFKYNNIIFIVGTIILLCKYNKSIFRKRETCGLEGRGRKVKMKYLITLS